MNITLNLSRDLEKKLQNKARQEGKEITQVITELLTTLLDWETEDTREAVKGIEQGLADFELGNYHSFEDFKEGQIQKYGLST